eukprot:SAG31_NODE_3214_length_4535_cov_2.601306_5_plen_132_part_00
MCHALGLMHQIANSSDAGLFVAAAAAACMCHDRFLRGLCAHHAPWQPDRTFVANNNAAYSLQLWDMPGLQRLHQLLSLYYREAEAAVVLYDITNSKSFERVKRACVLDDRNPFRVRLSCPVCPIVSVCFAG